MATVVVSTNFLSTTCFFGLRRAAILLAEVLAPKPG
jgi:hypothetical protein